MVSGIPDKIKELRLLHNYSQSDLARKLNVTRSSINAWESGVSLPSTEKLIDIAACFHVTSDYLLGIGNKKTIDISQLTDDEQKIFFSLMKIMKKGKKNTEK